MGRSTGQTKSTSAGRDERFSLHFPRLYAYIYGVTGDEELAKEATIAALASVLDAKLLDDHDFTQALYTAARKLTQGQRNAVKDGLNAKEREVLSLLFDAQLTRPEVSELLGIDGVTLLETVVDGLKKVRQQAGAATTGQMRPVSA